VRSAAAFALCAVVVLLTPVLSVAKEPPNQKDPCSRAGRNTCGTLGVGFYRNYRYGLRWFGDFRKAVPGEARTFCLDLRYWYASPDYRYREDRSGPLRNTEGEVVPLERQQKIAYAIWTYGRSTSATRQAAVALYVHSLMGDARPGEADPAELGQAVVSAFERVARASERYHGPYRVQTRLAGPLRVGEPASMAIRVVSAAGHALPHVQLGVSAPGVAAPARKIRTDADGLARIVFTPTLAGPLRITVESGPVASTVPRVFAPTTKAAARNGQRLAAPSSQRVSATVTATVEATPVVTASASAEVVGPGTTIFARIGVTGLGETVATIEVQLFGPFRSRSDLRCVGRPYSRSMVTAEGDSTIRSPATEVAEAGFYTYRARVLSAPGVAASTTECARAAATSLTRPMILTGSGDAAGEASARARGGSVPTRVRLDAVGIDAPVTPIAIDLDRGALGVPRDVGRAGWWKDGAAPGAASGAILISGHVDTARDGPGAFFSLRRARAGDRVRVTAGSGRTFVYRVVSVRNYRKEALPTSIFSRRGRGRLVLVTCGGPFDPATRRYRDNVVVTAVP
jgi:hypothetical protein